MERAKENRVKKELVEHHFVTASETPGKTHRRNGTLFL